MSYLNEAVLIIATYMLVKSVLSFKRAMEMKDVASARKMINDDYEKKLKAINNPSAKTLTLMARQISFAVSSVLFIASSYALYCVLK